MSKKYEITTEVETLVTPDGRHVKVNRIRRLWDGELGGYIEKPSNLNQDGLCWVHDRAAAIGESNVADDAQVRDRALLMDRAQVGGESVVRGRAEVSGVAQVMDRAVVREWAKVRDTFLGSDVVAEGECEITGENIDLDGHVRVTGKAKVQDGAVATNDQVIDYDLSHDLDAEQYLAWEAEHPNPMPEWAQSGEHRDEIRAFLDATAGQSHAILPREHESLGMLPSGLLDRYDHLHKAGLYDELYDSEGRATLTVQGVSVLSVTERLAAALGIGSAKMGRGFRFAELREGMYARLGGASEDQEEVAEQSVAG